MLSARSKKRMAPSPVTSSEHRGGSTFLVNISIIRCSYVRSVHLTYSSSPTAGHTRSDRARHPYRDNLFSRAVRPLLSDHQQHVSQIRSENRLTGKVESQLGGRGWARHRLDGVRQSEYSGGDRSKSRTACLDAMAGRRCYSGRCRFECEYHGTIL